LLGEPRRVDSVLDELDARRSDRAGQDGSFAFGHRDEHVRRAQQQSDQATLQWRLEPGPQAATVCVDRDRGDSPQPGDGSEESRADDRRQRIHRGVDRHRVSSRRFPPHAPPVRDGASGVARAGSSTFGCGLGSAEVAEAHVVPSRQLRGQQVEVRRDAAAFGLALANQ
jgi:hypothetical protein